MPLLRNRTPCLLFEQFFPERLPEDVRIQLVDDKFKDHRELTRRADIFWSSRNIGEIVVTHAIQHQSSVNWQRQPDKRSSAPDPS